MGLLMLSISTLMLGCIASKARMPSWYGFSPDTPVSHVETRIVTGAWARCAAAPAGPAISARTSARTPREKNRFMVVDIVDASCYMLGRLHRRNTVQTYLTIRLGLRGPLRYCRRVRLLGHHGTDALPALRLRPWHSAARCRPNDQGPP